MTRLAPLLVLLMLAAGFAPARAAPQILPVFGSDFPPYAYEDNGRAAGSATDRVRGILQAAGLTAVIEIYPWARAYRAARATPDALLYPVARTPEREDEFIWLGELVDYDVRLWRLADRRDIVLTSLADAEGFSFGGLPDDAKTGYLREQGMTVSLQSNEDILLTMLINGRIDLMPADRVSFLARLQRDGLDSRGFVAALALPAVSRPLYLAISRGADPDLVARLAAAFGPTAKPESLKSQ
ncbi:MAG: transporter substrate-binding domain-containing protein [Alphaproteobacteria bacterium]|jgi:polar amino acid transport system substrate-binding protein|nr:transporter substrate-binding domain-containing protein [Alphaproteobacteria bacterium]